MNDYIATSAAYGITGFGIWWFTRNSKSRYVRRQWRKPHWILGRLLIVFLILHVIFVLTGVPTGRGYFFVGLFSLFAVAGDHFGGITLLLGILGFIFHEWVFWFPKRRQYLLQNPRPTKALCRDQFIGVEAVTVSDLKPVGMVLVAGVEHAARSDHGFVSKGNRVIVKSVGDFELVVRPVDN